MRKSIFPKACLLVTNALDGTHLSTNNCYNYVPQWWVEFDDELSWLFTNWFSDTRYMKVKRMGITKILRRIWLFPVNKTESSESFSKQPTQLIVKLHSSLWHIFVTNITLKPQNSLIAPSTRHEKWADWTDHVCLMINCKKGASGYTVNLLIYCE